MEKSPKISKNFSCDLCNYICCKKGDYVKHINTSKHHNRTKLNNLEQKVAKKSSNFICKYCNKIYNARNSLWYHEQKCKIEDISVTEESNHKKLYEATDKDLVMMLIKENSELKTMMMEVIKNGTHNTTNNNSHNKSFNLNFFLNETCKDAMNITDFVESIKLQLSDLERVGELGYVEGISNIIVKNLKDLDVTQRPVHCTDKKRETMYIKDENKWEKDEEQKKMHKMVRKVADKNARMLPKFKEAHPDCIKSASLYSDQYNKIIMESMGGRGDNDFEKEEKIIKKVSKEVMVEKDTL